MRGNFNCEVAKQTCDAVNAHQAPVSDGIVAEALSDLFCTFGTFLPATSGDLHSGQRHTHVSPILGPRRIDFVVCAPADRALPARQLGWRNRLSWLSQLWLS